MGQGRNALYLAQQGWEVTGFDPAEKAVAAANAEAGRLGLKLTTLTVGDEELDFGKGQSVGSRGAELCQPATSRATSFRFAQARWPSDRRGLSP